MQNDDDDGGGGGGGGGRLQKYAEVIWTELLQKTKQEQESISAPQAYSCTTYPAFVIFNPLTLTPAKTGHVVEDTLSPTFSVRYFILL